MKGAGLTVRGFYGHFASKEQLFTGTIRVAASTLWMRLLSSAKGSSPRERARSEFLQAAKNLAGRVLVDDET